MKKIITTSILSIAFMGVAQSFALTAPLTPTPMPPTTKPAVKADAPTSRDEYIKKALAEGKITQTQADGLLKKAPQAPTPMNENTSSSSMKVMKNSIAETKSASKRGEEPKGLMMKNSTSKASSTKKMDTSKMGKMNSNSKPVMRPTPQQIPGATVAQ